MQAKLLISGFNDPICLSQKDLFLKVTYNNLSLNLDLLRFEITNKNNLSKEELINYFKFILYELIDVEENTFPKYCSIYNVDKEKLKKQYFELKSLFNEIQNIMHWSLDDLISINDYIIKQQIKSYGKAKKLETNI